MDRFRVILLHHSLLPAALPPAVEARWLAALPPERAASVAKRNADADRASALAGVALLASCSRAAGIGPPPLQQLVFPAGGKPAWPGGPVFSISNAAGRAACALAPVGVDVGLDLERRGTATAENLRRVSSEEEQVLYEGAALTPTDLWVAKEAVTKAAGVSATQAAQVRLGLDSATLDGRRFLLRRPFIAEDIAAALATSEELEVEVTQVDALELLGRGP